MKKRLPILILTVILLLLSVFLVIEFTNTPSLDSYFSVPTWDWLYEAEGVYVSGNGLQAKSLGEYRTCLELLAEDANFVTYETLAFLGSFEMFLYQSAWNYGEFGDYYYSFSDKTGFAYSLQVSNPGNSVEWDTIERVPDLFDLRTIDTEKFVQFENEGIQYVYLDGYLNFVEWEYGEREFQVSVFGHNDDPMAYDLQSGTFLSRLMNTETAKEAVEKFNARVAVGEAFRKTSNVRVIGQWTAAAGMLIWGILQLLNVPVELRKTIKGIEDEQLRRSYRRQCGVVKLAAAAVLAYMGFVELSQPIFAIGFILVYCALLALLLWQQKLTNRKFPTTPCPQIE